MTYRIHKERKAVCPCGEKFFKVGIKPFHPYHSPACALKFKTGKVDMENLVDLPLQRLRDMARGAFQQFIKDRDKDQPDITTGLPFKKGDVIQAGHLFKVELFPGLMFNEDNCFAQSEYGNLNMDSTEVYYMTHENAKRRIGIDRYSQLKDQTSIFTSTARLKKWDKWGFIEIINTYKK